MKGLWGEINMLTISNLSVSIDGKQILNSLNLSLEPGSIHVLMGSNGSGKSTLAHTLMGHQQYQIAQGSILLNAHDITELAVDKRAQAGLFLAFQHPYEIPGVTVFNFLKEAHYALSKKIMAPKEFQELIYAKMQLLDMDIGFAHRELNYGFSGGEKKKLELLQLLVLNPRVAILDEIDSGLDIDAIKIVGKGIQYARQENPELSFLIITHNPRLLDHINADRVHVMSKGTIVETGSAMLAAAIEQRGYDAYTS